MGSDEDDLAGFGEEPYGNEVEPLVGSTLNLFKLSGKNIPTETEKYESSVY